MPAVETIYLAEGDWQGGRNGAFLESFAQDANAFFPKGVGGDAEQMCCNDQVPESIAELFSSDFALGLQQLVASCFLDR